MPTPSLVKAVQRLRAINNRIPYDRLQAQAQNVENQFQSVANTMSQPQNTSLATFVSDDSNRNNMYNAISPFGQVNPNLTQGLSDSEAKSISTLKNQSITKAPL